MRTPETLRSLLGPTVQQEEAAYGDLWSISESLNLHAYYKRDGKSLRSLVLTLPEP
jgi:hypothetical protein